MKYAIVIPLDQTIGFITPDGAVTTSHKDALLHEEKAAADVDVILHAPADLMEVKNEEEFRARPDTW